MSCERDKHGRVGCGISGRGWLRMWWRGLGFCRCSPEQDRYASIIASSGGGVRNAKDITRKKVSCIDQGGVCYAGVRFGWRCFFAVVVVWVIERVIPLLGWSIDIRKVR